MQFATSIWVDVFGYRDSFRISTPIRGMFVALNGHCRSIGNFWTSDSDSASLNTYDHYNPASTSQKLNL